MNVPIDFLGVCCLPWPRPFLALLVSRSQMYTSIVLIHWKKNNAQCCGWKIPCYFPCCEMLHPPEENLFMCQYVCTWAYCAKAARGRAGHRAWRGFPAGLCFFLQCFIPCSGHLGSTLLQVPLQSPPGPADLGFPVLMFTSQHCQLIAKSTAGLELGRGSADDSGRAQGDLYATWPARPPICAWARNSQWSCSGRNPTLSLGALSQKEEEQGWRHMQEAAANSRAAKSQGLALSTTSLVPPRGQA